MNPPILHQTFAYFKRGQGGYKTYFIGKDSSKGITHNAREGENIAELLLRGLGGFRLYNHSCSSVAHYIFLKKATAYYVGCSFFICI